MSMIEAGAPSRGGRMLARTAEEPAGLIGRMLRRARRRHAARRTASGLLGLGDRLLRDIGISRADAESLFR
jgi:uncharacterized protein YjiS (DUF1127 family)